MSEASQQQRVLRWRRLFQVVYFSLTGSLCAWTLASVSSVHLGLRQPTLQLHRPMIHPAADRPQELRSCLQEVEGLLSSLYNEMAALPTTALRYRVAPHVEWSDWVASWRHRWNMSDRRCRLSTLGDKDVSPEIDVLHQVHEELEQLQLSCSETVDRFVDRFVDRLGRLRQQLDQVRISIDRRERKAHNHEAILERSTELVRP